MSLGKKDARLQYRRVGKAADASIVSALRDGRYDRDVAAYLTAYYVSALAEKPLSRLDKALERQLNKGFGGEFERVVK
jgi:hypothetical protein